MKQGAKDVFGGDGFASSVDYGIKKGIESDSSKEGQEKEKSSVEVFQRGLETADSVKDFAKSSLRNDTAKEYPLRSSLVSPSLLLCSASLPLWSTA
ncbi:MULTISPECIES: hypothetical protein [Corynebacterium]|uniref:hypothetical protein n=1 Tax=Corynebacterium TaxID=1716 RepID=UPI001055378F|nr:hypothetical protein [Corynebacterium hadale]